MLKSSSVGGNDERKTKAQLLAELAGARRRVSQLETAEASRPQLTNILERVSDSFVALDTNWCYTYVNEKAAQTFNRRREDLIGKHIWTEFPEGIGQPFYHAYYQVVETQQPIYLEEYYPPYDRWFENRIYPSKDGLSIFFHDITDRKRLEIALHENEELLTQSFAIGDVMKENRKSIFG